MNCDNCSNQNKRRICKVCYEGSCFEENKTIKSIEKEKNIAKILEETCNEMCDKYCKYPGMFTSEEWEDVFEDICDKCPLMKLV